MEQRVTRRWLAGVALAAMLAIPTPCAWGQHRPGPAGGPPPRGEGKPMPPPPRRGPEPPPRRPQASVETLPNAAITVSRIRRLPENFQQVSSLCWSPDGRSLLVDRVRNGVYEMAVVDVPPEWNERQRLREKTLLSVPMTMRRFGQQHRGAPRWRPGRPGQFVFVSQMPQARDYNASMPWNGWFCNLELGDIGHHRVVPLTQNNPSPQRPQGAASPAFSPDGRQLFWCGVNGRDKENTMWGQRQMYLAEVLEQGGRATLANVRQVRHPESGSFVETYGFSRDGGSLLYAASQKERPWFFIDLFGYDMKQGILRNLTEDASGWNRWASYSPQGSKIIWSSAFGLINPNMGVGGSRWQLELRSELWLMNADGSDKRRLTSFNRPDTIDNRLLGITSYQHCYVGESAWSPDGRTIAAVVHLSGQVPTSIVVLLDVVAR